MKKFALLATTALVIVAIACNKEAGDSPIPVNFNNETSLKIVYTSAYITRDSVQLRVNGNRVSNTFLSPTTTNTPTPFPGGGLNTGGSNFPYYLDVPAGSTSISVAIPKKLTNIDSIVRFNGTTTLEAAKKYSAYITDTAANSKLVLVPETGVQPATNTSIYKFVNLIPNQPAIDLYFKNQLVAGNVAYGAYSPEFTLPKDSTGQWAIRIAGTAPTSTAITTYPTGTSVNTVPNQRIFTVFCKGYTGAAAPRLPIISLLYN